MNKVSFRLTFLAVLSSSLCGCASPMRLFAKKPQGFEEFKAQRNAEQTRVAGSQATPGSPAEVAELLHKGHAAFQQGNMPEAQSNYWAVVQRQPNHPVANHRLGVIADRQQDYLTAQRHYFAALNAAPNDANLLNDIGYSFLLQSRYPEAENYLQAALQKNPKQSHAINNLGLLYAKQGQPDRALALFRMTNSEAEAQAKLATLLPSSAGPAAQAGSMLANNAWPPTNVNTLNPAAYNAAPNNVAPYNVPPYNPSLARNGAPSWPNEMATNLPNGIGTPPNYSAGWVPPEAMSQNGSSPIAQTGANFPATKIDDPNVPEATRRLKEQMESARLKAISERRASDHAEQQRREILSRQLRDEELGRSNLMNAIGSPQSNVYRGNGSLNSPSNAISNAPIMAGPPLNANMPNSNVWQTTPSGSMPQNGAAPLNSPNAWGGATANVPANAAFDVMPNGMPNPNPAPIPNLQSQGALPAAGADSPLDTMPTWPPAGSLPVSAPNNAAWPNASRPGVADDPARAASRLGMNAGPGNLFPITPAPNSATISSPNWPNPANTPNNFAPSNGVSPMTPPNWPANPNRQGYGPATGEPPVGSFGPSNFSTSANSQPQLPESAAQFALQDQLPPSEQYQTPGRFGVSPTANGPTAQRASFTTNRSTGGTPAPQLTSQSYPTSDPAQQAKFLDRASTRATVPDRFGGDDRGEQGPAQAMNNPPMSVPTLQGYMATPLGETSLTDYERMIQQHNAETNLIRQQIDAQRQLPGSENYYRSRTQPQTGTPNGLNARSQ